MKIYLKTSGVVYIEHNNKLVSFFYGHTIRKIQSDKEISILELFNYFYKFGNVYIIEKLYSVYYKR